MAVTYGFFDAVYDSGTGTYDRTYTAEQMSMYFKGLISDGVIANVGQMLVVTPGTGMAVQVGTGRMIVDSHWMQNDTVYDITVEAAHQTLPRKDIIFVRLDYSMRTISIEIKKGTPAATPVAPTLARDSAWYDMELAEITIPAGATAITASMITDMRQDESVCGYVTGLVDQIETSGMWAQLQADFETWFDMMKGQLSDDAAGNLQLEIDDLSDEIDVVQTNMHAMNLRMAGINTTLTLLTGTQSQSSNGEDFNNMITAGSYQCGYLAGMPHAPYPSGHGILEVVRARSYVVQRFTYMALSNSYWMFVRSSADKGQTWKPWARIQLTV